MQGVSCRPLTDGGRAPSSSPLSIDVVEPTEARIQRLVSENPVIIFSRRSCCMCHVMRRLLATLGVHPTVIELEDHEMERARSANDSGAPAVFIGGAHVGGLESLMGLHVSGRLLPRLREVGVVEVTCQLI
ncbi:glutaredoxin-C6 [Cinnamomum micranthum f. kanehirae]|uniref:Glutaredoxin-C6 n=1 Tax=Cinnamomum micranthum f. kanehirae TaxID=337451 RepID=A0A3S3M5M4_9MAGN|nr:glutaredoxin-C6 [Cinnamomum micranthum f. kanehirae]